MSKRTCSLDDCERPHSGNGYCRRHNRLNKLYGDPRITRHTPNVRAVREDGVGTVMVTREDGTQMLGLYDAADADLVSSFTWFAQASGGYLASTTGSTAKRVVRTTMHRLVLGLSSDDPVVVDHINGVRFDNRRANLRVGDQRDNAVNRAIVNRLGTSRFRGVSWDASRKRWAAHVGLDYRLHHLGRFTTEEEAAAAVAEFRRKRGLPAGY